MTAVSVSTRRLIANAADTVESTAAHAMPVSARPDRTVVRAAATPLPRRSPGEFACAGIASDRGDDSTPRAAGRSIGLLDGARRAGSRPRTAVSDVWAEFFAGVTAARDRSAS